MNQHTTDQTPRNPIHRRKCDRDDAAELADARRTLAHYDAQRALAVEPQKDARIAELTALVKYILDHGACYPSAIERDGMDGDFEEWAARAQATLNLQAA